MRKFSIKRPLTEYTKVQAVIGRFVRGRSLFISKKKSGIEYLDIGCGPNMSDEFINLDYNWSPKIDLISAKPQPRKLVASRSRVSGLGSHWIIA